MSDISLAVKQLGRLASPSLTITHSCNVLHGMVESRDATVVISLAGCYVDRAATAVELVTDLAADSKMCYIM